MTDWFDLSVAERDDIVRQGMINGELAYTEGHTIDDCPYPRMSQEATWWRRGFMNAKTGYEISNALPAA